MDFEAIALNQARSLNERIHTYEESLHTLRNLFLASENVSRAEFELVCQELRGRQSGIHQILWLPYVKDADRIRLERDAKTEVHPNWQINNGKDRETRQTAYLPILYTSPSQGFGEELGFDQLRGPHERAVLRAIETGEIAATRRIPLQVDSDAEFGWMTFLAVYEYGPKPASIDERWAKLRGVVQGEFRFNELLIRDPGGLNNALQFVMTDETPGSTEPYLLNFERGKLSMAPPPLAEELRHPMKMVHPIQSAGRQWRMHVQPDLTWLSTKNTGFPFVVLTFGLWLTAFLAASIHATRRRTETINRLVATRTEQLRDVEDQLRKDIRKRREAEERYHAFIKQSSEAIWRFEMDEPMPLDWPDERQVEYINEHAYLAECNDTCARMYGYDRSDELVGMRLSKLMPLSDSMNRKNLETFVRSGYRLFDSESRESDRSGNVHIILNNAVGIIENERFVRGWGTQRDVTDKRLLEQERMADAKRLQIAIEAANLGLWEWDALSNTLTWNDQLLEMHGLTREEFTGKYEIFTRCVHPDDRDRMEGEVQRVLANPAERYECEYRMSRPNGIVRWIYTRGHVQTDQNGKSIGMLGAAIDITTRKEEEESRALMEQKLQQTQKLESLGILAGGIAHDFNNLLTGVLGNASLARMDLPPSSPVQPYLQQIEQSSQRAADLCKQMLAYSGKGRFVVQRVNLSHLVEDGIPLLHVSVAKDASIKLRLAHPLPAVNADATQLRQILMNLVINASDAIGSRPGAIEIRTGVVEVDTAYLATTHLAPNLPGGRYVYLEVSDTGSGMDAETLKRIFDPFFTTKFTGRGLGLAAVLGIVRGHLGALNVSSEPGRGTTFTLLLPEVEGHADDLVAPAPPRSAWRGSGRVLIIDDEEAVRRAAAQMLKSIGFESVAAVDGRQGLDLFAAHPDAFQAILLDLTMPRLDGAKTFDQLNRLTRKVPIVVMSGFSEQEAMSQFDPGEIAGFLQKPFKPEELQAILQRAFECGQVRLSEGTCRMP